jgi:ADP-ribose pyrophosphatase YjhB (NUDIX family)
VTTAPGADGPAARIHRAAVTLAALAQSGLSYGPGEFDADRYRKMAVVAADLLEATSVEVPAADWLADLGRDQGHATPKVDVRGALVDAQDRILLMQERSDHRWSLPGGWADPGDTPTGAVVREIREETGYPAEVVKLVGVWDRDTRGHRPRLPISIYKLFFLCRVTGAPTAPDALETLDVGWFPLDELPELSPGRVNRWELERMVAHARNPGLPTEYD